MNVIISDLWEVNDMATLGDAYSFTATKAAVRSVMPVIRDKTPAKSPGPRRMSGFQHYLLQEHHSLGAKYPFLTQSQIKSKIAKNWSKLNDTDKDEYIPIKIRLVAKSFIFCVCHFGWRSTKSCNISIYNYPWNLKFRGYYGLVWTPPPPPDAKACVSRNCDTNARIKFIFDTAIDDLEWKNPIDFGENR